MRISVAAVLVLAAGMVILSCWLLMKLAASVVVVDAVLARSRTTAPVMKFCPERVTGMAWFKASKVAGALL